MSGSESSEVPTTTTGEKVEEQDKGSLKKDQEKQEGGKEATTGQEGQVKGQGQVGTETVAPPSQSKSSQVQAQSVSASGLLPGSLPGSPSVKPKDKASKINVLLKPVGDAPILKQKLWAVDPDKQVSGIIQFINNYLRLEPNHSLFVFVNQAFAPSPDQLIRNLYECFGSDGKLVLHYSTTVAWG